MVPFAPVGTALPDGRVLTSRGDPRHPVRGHAVLGPRAGRRQRPLGDHGAPGDSDGRRAVRRRHRPRRRRRLRPRRDAQPPRLSRAPRRGPRPGGVARPAARRARADDRGRPAPSAARRSTSSPATRARRFTTVVLSGVRVGSERAVDGGPTARGRSAPDQQRGRREQLRHARAEPAEPRLRPRHLGWRRLPGSPRRAGGAPHDPRRRRPRAHRSRPADLRRPRCADRAGRDHGRRGHRDHRRHVHGGARVRLVRAVRHRRHGERGPACAATPRRGSSAASTPTASTVASPASSSCSARRAPNWSCTPARSTRARRPLPASGAELRRARRQRQPHPRHRPRRAATSPGCSTRSATPSTAPAPSCDGGAAVVATGLDRGDRRHRGGRAPLRLRQHREACAAVAAARSPQRAPAAPPAAAPGARRSRCVGGDAEPVPVRRARRRTPGSSGDAAAHHQPARRRRGRAAAVVAPGTAAGGGVQRVAPPARASWLFEIGHVYRPGAGRAARRARGARAACSPARRHRRRWRRGGRSPRRCRSARGSTRPTCQSGCTRRARPRSSPGASASARSARSPPRCSRRSASTSGWRCSRSTSTSPWRTSPSRPRWKPTGRHPSSDLDLAFVLARRRPGRATRQGDPPGRRQPARRPRCRSTATAVRACPRARAAWRSACGCRRRTARSPTPTSAAVVTAVTAAAGKLGAVLRR